MYDVLLRERKALYGQIIKKTRLHRSVVYDTMDKLVKKGVVYVVIENGTKVFYAEPLQVLIDKSKEEQELAKQKELLVLKIQRKLENAHMCDEHDILVYKGSKGMVTFFNTLLEEDKSCLVMGAPRESADMMPPGYWGKYNRLVSENGGKPKYLFNDSLREWAKTNIGGIPHISVRYLPKQFDPLTETCITKKSLYLSIWKLAPVGIIIRDENVAKSYRQYFDHLWKLAKN